MASKTLSDAMTAQSSEPLVPNPSSVSIDAPVIPVLRKLGAVDRHDVETHLLRLDSTDRRMRFCHVVSDRSIALHCEHIDWSRTIGLGCFIDRHLRGMAELRLGREITGSIAELAITVETSFQNKGIGTMLLRKMLTIARNRFVGRIYMICLLENRRMQHIAGKLEANLTFREGEVEARLWPPLPSYLTLIEEASIDSQALWRAVLDDTHTTTRHRANGQGHAS